MKYLHSYHIVIIAESERDCRIFFILFNRALIPHKAEFASLIRGSPVKWSANLTGQAEFAERKAKRNKFSVSFVSLW